MNVKINRQILKRGQLASLSIPADVQYLPLLHSFARGIANWFSFRENDIHDIELIVEETFVNIIENSFEPGELGACDVFFSYKPGKLVIAFEDKGLPLDIEKLEREEKSATGFLLIKHLADEFSFINKGSQGKRWELAKNLPIENIDEILIDEKPPAEVIQASKDEQLTFRMLVPEDAIELSRLAYRAYGYTYVNVVYYPNKIRELLEHGLMHGCAAVNSNGELIAHLGLFSEKPESKVVDSSMAVVDPKYRGHNLFKRLKSQAVEFGIKTGLYGLYSESVTIHPFTQKGNITLGASEIGSLLAFTQESVSFKKIDEEGTGERQAVILFYLRLNAEEKRTIFLPPEYAEITSEIYSRLKLNREIVTSTEGKLDKLKPNSSIDVNFKPDLNSAMMIVKEYGNDIVSIVRHHLKEFCLKKIDTIYLDLPLSDAATMRFAKDFNKLGFFFGGAIPEFREGDVLKLQYLNNILVDPEKIIAVSDFGKKLLKFILDDRQRTTF
jgi:serine/threonine-protein kinase RsbW